MNGAVVHIGELSERTGVSRRSLRYYEQRGLLRAQRTDAGWRTYDADAVTRVRNVRSLLDAGMTVEDIQQLAPCLAEDDHATCVDTGAAITTHQARLQVLDSQIAQLQLYRTKLLGRIARLRATAAKQEQSTEVR
ncbi:MerR family transcriptional regulator [Tamaricihabitans halophyticus]|nr:MerR family transcriptional regulator [Tamaricihabitans halophyticus]